MFAITKIERIDKAPYEEIHTRDSKVVLSPVLAFFELTIDANGVQRCFEAEVRSAPRDTLQIDWDDDVEEFMVEHRLESSYHNDLALAIHAAYHGEPSVLPIQLNRRHRE